jgi:hypothetical protein
MSALRRWRGLDRHGGQKRSADGVIAVLTSNPELNRGVGSRISMATDFLPIEDRERALQFIRCRRLFDPSAVRELVVGPPNQVGRYGLRHTAG